MFSGQPEHVVNFLWMIAEDVREHMAQLGLRTFNEMVGRVDLMQPSKEMNTKAMSLDLSCILVSAKQLNPNATTYCSEKQQLEVPLDQVLDSRIMNKLSSAIESGSKVKANFRIYNTDRTVGTLLSHYLTKKHGVNGLPDNTIHLRFRGTAGQSFGAWLAAGVTCELNGDANDYVGKGLSGGNVIIYPPKDSSFIAEKNVIAGNVCLYGATGGSAFIRGRALQRFAVRNSGANVVVEGIGDHGCEYMTGGTVVVLGATGRNFAAGMSGGVAYIYDPELRFPANCNRGLVQLEKVIDQDDMEELESLLEAHRLYTGSAIADRLLWNWPDSSKQFVKVIPTEYKNVLLKAKQKKQQKHLEHSQTQSTDNNTSAVQRRGSTSQSAGYGETVPKQHEINVSRNDQRFNSGFELVGSSEPRQEKQANEFGKSNNQVQSNKTSAKLMIQPIDYDDWYTNSKITETIVAAEDQGIRVDVVQQSPEKQSLSSCGSGGCGSSSKPSSGISMNSTAGSAAGNISGGGLPGKDIEELGPMDKQKPKRPVVVDKPQKKRGFIEYERGVIKYRDAGTRLSDFDEIYERRDEKQLTTQAARCMDCGVPYVIL